MISKDMSCQPYYHQRQLALDRPYLKINNPLLLNKVRWSNMVAMATVIIDEFEITNNNNDALSVVFTVSKYSLYLSI